MTQANKRRRATPLTVSLFPFLAVLICTMGILIVLLVISVQSAEVQSQSRKDDHAQTQQQMLTELTERTELMSFEAKSIESVRVDVSERLAVAKADRSYLEQQLKQIESDARQLYLQYRQLQRLKNKDATDNAAAPSTPNDVLEKQVTDAEQKLARARTEIAQQDTPIKFQIVPYAGSGGTNRQPIFVECDAAGLLLQPYGIRLGKSDFINPNVIGNVLDSALLAIRDYYKKHQLTDEDGRPYPLLVIRPGGASSYALARRAMQSWDDEFGYELVEETLPLEYGQADPTLKKEIQSTIRDAYSRQKIAALRDRRKQQRYGTVYQASTGGQTSPSGQITSDGQTSRFNSSYQQNDPGDNSTGAVQQASRLEANPTTGTGTNNGTSETQRNLAQTQNGAAATQTGGKPTADPAATGNAGGNHRIGSGIASLANQRGANWALPTQASNANAYVRPIRIACEANRMLILSQDKVVATIPITGPTRTAVDPLVSAVWKTIDQWGAAGPNAFWQPEMRFSILPGGQQRFADLQTLLNKSGLILKTQP